MTWRSSKTAQAGELVLRSQDEARCSMIPTLWTPLGLKGHWPSVGHLDGYDLVYVCGALNLVTGRLTTPLGEKVSAQAPSKPRCLGQRSWPAGVAPHGREIAPAYPATHYPHVVLVSDNAPWHRGALITQALSACPHREGPRLPSDRPQLQLIERFWKVWRRRATHHRLLLTLARPTRALRNSLCYDQTLLHRVLS